MLGTKLQLVQFTSVDMKCFSTLLIFCSFAIRVLSIDVKVSSIFKQQKKPTDPYFINNTMVVQGI